MNCPLFPEHLVRNHLVVAVKHWGQIRVEVGAEHQHQNQAVVVANPYRLPQPKSVHLDLNQGPHLLTAYSLLSTQQ